MLETRARDDALGLDLVPCGPEEGTEVKFVIEGTEVKFVMVRDSSLTIRSCALVAPE